LVEPETYRGTVNCITFAFLPIKFVTLLVSVAGPHHFDAAPGKMVNCLRWLWHFVTFLNNLFMLHISFRAGITKMMRLRLRDTDFSN
jgi:hypothetical protein